MQLRSACAKSDEESAWYRLHSVAKKKLAKGELAVETGSTVQKERAGPVVAGPTAATRSRLVRSMMEVAEPTVAN